ncbi:phenazine biosynthesis protein PhzF family [[Leptolyngbya] sp. PCC 7376]|uniref:PhzF family phenazine biosynthesis protein n=1 Tax=[Leptolyngbya] sp. PCC 7376 TaxID=111781 RepID=UPI00029ECDF8|nr:PhzF family phenazine biosynthesis protein [[Leptolyngbya] sp. PCC 7376]AFY38010.1 phenazine biosynthesis protein PhzF family [[Leptolyngbya] sp. PCC 7376]
MTRYIFHTLDVFTNQIFGGNPLAVFPEAEGLSSQQMQAIAQELNLSETVFVLPSENEVCDFKLRIFTPRAEIPFAGHPTVGTAYLLAYLGKVLPLKHIINLEEGVGTIPVALHWFDKQIQTTALQAAQLPAFSVSPSLDIANLLSLEANDLADNLDAAVISCGLPFFYIPLTTKEAVDNCALNMTLWQKELAQSDSQNIYIFTVEKNEIYARMFAPGLGITEDPATGSAATSLAGYLHKYIDSETSEQTWQITQGIKMGRSSELLLTFKLENKQISMISVGGSSVLVSCGEMNVC